MSAKKVKNAVEETAKEEVKKVEETAVEKTAVSETEAEKVKIEEPIKEEEVKKVEAKKVKLKVLIAFTDKYDTKIHYKENYIVEFEEERAKELLADTRRLVEKAD